MDQPTSTLKHSQTTMPCQACSCLVSGGDLVDGVTLEKQKNRAGTQVRPAEVSQTRRPPASTASLHRAFFPKSHSHTAGMRQHICTTTTWRGRKAKARQGTALIFLCGGNEGRKCIRATGRALDDTHYSTASFSPVLWPFCMAHCTMNPVGNAMNKGRRQTTLVLACRVESEPGSIRNSLCRDRFDELRIGPSCPQYKLSTSS